VLAGTFAALATLPVTFLAELGFAVAFGILLDTIVVRSVLVTALNLDGLPSHPPASSDPVDLCSPAGYSRRHGEASSARLICGDTD
jgi:MMPL family